MRAAPFEWISDSQIWPDLDTDRDDFEYLLKTFGVARRGAFNISRHDSWDAILALHFEEGVQSPLAGTMNDAIVCMRHVSKAIELNRFFFDLRDRYKAALSILDRVDVGVCLANAAGSVLVENTRALKIFNARDGVTKGRQHHLLLANEDLQRSVQAQIQSCAGTAAGSANTFEHVLTVPKRSGGQPYVVEISPIRDGDDELNDKFSGVMILILDPDDPPDVRIDPVAALYRLSKAETEVLSLIARGKLLSCIAEIRSVSEQTVRNQLRSIYSKLSVSNRADLIRKIMSVSPPVLV